jgi:hypothetical protein
VDLNYCLKNEEANIIVYANKIFFKKIKVKQKYKIKNAILNKYNNIQNEIGFE